MELYSLLQNLGLLGCKKEEPAESFVKNFISKHGSMRKYLI